VRCRIDTDLTAVAQEPCAPYIWHRDPRFAEFIPKEDSTVLEMERDAQMDGHFWWSVLDDGSSIL
jgi:hypothetical protein